MRIHVVRFDLQRCRRTEEHEEHEEPLRSLHAGEVQSELGVCRETCASAGRRGCSTSASFRAGMQERTRAAHITMNMGRLVIYCLSIGKCTTMFSSRLCLADVRH